MAKRLIALGLLFAASSAGAQTLADPTRPPAAANESSSDPSQQAGASRLQSILISSRRRVAVIDGRAVRIGERVGDALVVAIAPSEVTLQHGAVRETLKLHPGIDKKTVPPPEPGEVNP
jgi:MSHA biogenesis protein MshK